MFRWVFCQLDTLRHCFPPNLRQLVNEWPETLDKTYERILRGIKKAKKEDAHRLLQCLAVAARPRDGFELSGVRRRSEQLEGGIYPAIESIEL
ncbi:hypothetical protein EI94DRAFT_1740847 [Lactarius quietus]|nr:hypothetical protein EI94DRAFT_1740847 [Lactarius quietus]